MLTTILGLGVAMIVAGLYFVYAGFDYIMLERGWTMVIAGTTLGSAGAVLVGLWTLAREVRALRGGHAPLAREADAAPLADARAEPVADAPIPAPSAAAASLAPVGAGLAAAAVAEAATETLVAETETARDDSIEGATADDGTEGKEPPAAESPSGPTDMTAATPPVGEPEVPAETTAETSAREFTLDAIGAPLGEPSTESESRSAPPLDVRPSRDEPEADIPPLRIDEDLTVSDLLGTRPSPMPDEPAPPSEPAVEPESPAFDVPTVVGSYASGGHTYVMFSDGSIEAETPEGVFKFGSLDELKTFIASGEARPEPVT